MTPVNSSQTPTNVPRSGKVHQSLDIVNLLGMPGLAPPAATASNTQDSDMSGFLASENVWILLGFLLVGCFILLCSVVCLYKKYRSVRNVIKHFRRQIHREKALILVCAPSSEGSSPSDITCSSTKGGIVSVDKKGTIFYEGGDGSRKSADSDISSAAFSISSGRMGTVFYQGGDNEYFERQYDSRMSEWVATEEEKSSVDEVNANVSNRGESEGSYDRRMSEWAATGSDVDIDGQDSDEGGHGGGAIFYQPGSEERMSEGATSISIDEQQSGTIFFGTESDETERVGSDRNVSEGVTMVTTRICEHSGRRNILERKRRSLVHRPESDDELSRGERSPELPATRTKQIYSDAVVHKQTEEVLPDDVELSSPRTHEGRGPLFFRPASDANITHSRRNSEWESKSVGSRSQERESVNLNGTDDIKGNF